MEHLESLNFLSRAAVHKDISESGYKEMIRLAKNNDYKFVTFDTAAQESRYIILRHDVDLDLHYAVAMAELEHEFSVRSTYFLMLRNSLYNVWSKAGQQCIQRIVALGHNIGLHFDASFYMPCDRLTLAKYAAREVAHLSRASGGRVYFLSYHQPPQQLLTADFARTGVFESVYNSRYFREIRYISDAAGRWREESVLQLVSRGDTPKIQFLSHPALWFNSDASTLQERIGRTVAASAARLKEEFRSAINDPSRGMILYE